MDEWRVIAARPNYEICRDGRVRRVAAGQGAVAGKFIKPRINTTGYPFVTLWADRKMRSFNIHRLLAEAFLPRSPERTQVNHRNGIKTDNRLENLEWATPSENIQHAVRLGLFKGAPEVRRGEAAYHVKLSEEKVRRIRAMRAEGQVWRVIAEEMGMSIPGVWHVVNSHWKHVK